MRLWEEFLRRLPDLPASRPQTVADVRNALTLDVPTEPMPDDALFAHLEQIDIFVTDTCSVPEIRRICAEQEIELVDTANPV